MNSAKSILDKMIEEMPFQLIGKESIVPYLTEAIGLSQKDAYNEALRNVVSECVEIGAYYTIVDIHEIKDSLTKI